MELHEHLSLLRRQWRSLAVSLLLVVGLAGLVTLRTTPKYRTSVKFFVSTAGDNTDSPYTESLFSQQRVKSYANIVEGRTLAEEVAAASGLRPAAVIGKMSARPIAETVLLNVTVSDTSADRAYRIATVVAEVLPRMIGELEGTAGSAPVQLRVTERPVLPTEPFSPTPVRNLALASVLGALLGVGVAIVREALDNTVKSPEDVRAVADAVTLAAIFYDREAVRRPLVVQDQPHTSRAEAFRQLRTSLQFLEVDRPLRSFVITSAVPGEGKSTLACNLAITLAQAGIAVCLVEGDLRRPRIAEYLGVDGAAGLTNVVIGQSTLDDVLQPWGDGHLVVLTSGPLPPNPSELLSSRGAEQLIRDLERRFAVVIIDTPPLLPVTDAAILASATDGAVLVVRSGSTRKEQVARAGEALKVVDAKLLGTVLNMVPKRRSDAYVDYSYGQSDPSTTGGRSRKRPAEDARLATSPLYPFEAGEEGTGGRSQ